MIREHWLWTMYAAMAFMVTVPAVLSWYYHRRVRLFTGGKTPERRPATTRARTWQGWLESGQCRRDLASRAVGRIWSRGETIARAVFCRDHRLGGGAGNLVRDTAVCRGASESAGWLARYGSGDGIGSDDTTVTPVQPNLVATGLESARMFAELVTRTYNPCCGRLSLFGTDSSAELF